MKRQPFGRRFPDERGIRASGRKRAVGRIQGPGELRRAVYPQSRAGGDRHPGHDPGALRHAQGRRIRDEDRHVAVARNGNRPRAADLEERRRARSRPDLTTESQRRAGGRLKDGPSLKRQSGRDRVAAGPRLDERRRAAVRKRKRSGSAERQVLRPVDQKRADRHVRIDVNCRRDPERRLRAGGGRRAARPVARLRPRAARRGVPRGKRRRVGNRHRNQPVRGGKGVRLAGGWIRHAAGGRHLSGHCGGDERIRPVGHGPRELYAERTLKLRSRAYRDRLGAGRQHETAVCGGGKRLKRQGRPGERQAAAGREADGPGVMRRVADPQRRAHRHLRKGCGVRRRELERAAPDVVRADVGAGGREPQHACPKLGDAAVRLRGVVVAGDRRIVVDLVQHRVDDKAARPGVGMELARVTLNERIERARHIGFACQSRHERAAGGEEPHVYVFSGHALLRMLRQPAGPDLAALEGEPVVRRRVPERPQVNGVHGLPHDATGDRKVGRSRIREATVICAAQVHEAAVFDGYFRQAGVAKHLLLPKHPHAAVTNAHPGHVRRPVCPVDRVLRPPEAAGDIHGRVADQRHRLPVGDLASRRHDKRAGVDEEARQVHFVLDDRRAVLELRRGVTRDVVDRRVHVIDAADDVCAGTVEAEGVRRPERVRHARRIMLRIDRLVRKRPRQHQPASRRDLDVRVREGGHQRRRHLAGKAFRHVGGYADSAGMRPPHRNAHRAAGEQRMTGPRERRVASEGELRQQGDEWKVVHVSATFRRGGQGDGKVRLSLCGDAARHPR